MNKNIYRITNSNGVFLCWQIAQSEKEAVNTARMYGHKAVFASFAAKR